jgi:hypothetical protein
MHCAESRTLTKKLQRPQSHRLGINQAKCPLQRYCKLGPSGMEKMKGNMSWIDFHK